VTGHRVFAIEPLLGYPGHFLRAMSGLSRLIAPVPLIVFGSTRFKGVRRFGNMELRPYFPANIFVPMGFEGKPDAHYLDDLIRDCLAEFGPGDHLLVPSADLDVVSALARVTAGQDLRDLPHINLRFYALDLQTVSPEPATGTVIRDLLARPHAAQRVSVTTELAEMAAQIGTDWGVEGDWFPYLHPLMFAPEPPPRHAEMPATLRIGFCGHGKPDKGRHWIPHIINATRTRAPDLARRICWVVQSSGTYKSARDSIVPILEFDAQNPGLLELHTQDLSDQAYDDLFRSMDIIGLPYSAGNYRMRGSGVSAEATFSGKPFAYTQGTLLGSIAGDSAIAATTVVEFADALIEICTNYLDYQGRAFAAQDRLIATIPDLPLIRRLTRPAHAEA